MTDFATACDDACMEQELRGQDIHIGKSDVDSQGNPARGVFIAINDERMIFPGKSIRGIIACLEKWADYAEGKTQHVERPVGQPYDSFAVMSKTENRP